MLVESEFTYNTGQEDGEQINGHFWLKKNSAIFLLTINNRKHFLNIKGNINMTMDDRDELVKLLHLLNSAHLIVSIIVDRHSSRLQRLL